MVEGLAYAGRIRGTMYNKIICTKACWTFREVSKYHAKGYVLLILLFPSLTSKSSPLSPNSHVSPSFLLFRNWVGISFFLIRNIVYNALIVYLWLMNLKMPCFYWIFSLYYAFFVMLNVSQVNMNFLELHFCQLGLLI